MSLFSMFFKIYSKQPWISDIEYDPSGNSNVLFHVEADTLNWFCMNF